MIQTNSIPGLSIMQELFFRQQQFLRTAKVSDKLKGTLTAQEPIIKAKV